jgi:hypothetical protein
MRLLALVVALFVLPQDGKIALKFNPQKGDKLTRTQKMELQIKMQIDAGGGEQEMEVEHRGTEKSVIEYADVTDGKLSKLVVDYVENFEESKQPPTMEWNRKDGELHGRKITVSMKDGKLVREGVDGLKEKDVNKIDLDAGDSRLLPKDPLAVGESWELKGDDLRKFFGNDDVIRDGKMKAKLVEVKEIDKRRCAVIKGDIELSGKTEEGMNLKMKLDADIVVWIERGYTLSVKARGTIKMEGEGEGYSMKGEGPLSVDVATKLE